MQSKFDALFTEIGSVCAYWLNYRAHIGFDNRIPEAYLAIPISEYLTNVARKSPLYLDFEHSRKIGNRTQLIDLYIKEIKSNAGFASECFSEFKLLRTDQSYRYGSERDRILSDILRLGYLANSSNKKVESSSYFILFGRTEEFVDFAFFDSDIGELKPYREKPKFSGQFDFILSLNERNPNRVNSINDLKEKNLVPKNIGDSTLGYKLIETKLQFIRNIDSTIIVEDHDRSDIDPVPYVVAIWEISSTH